MPPTERTGHCLCGNVRFTFEPAAPEVDACHCTMCRRWSGGPGLSIRAASTPIISGAEHIAVFKSSDWGERHFCKTCGSHLFYNAPAFGYFGVSVGTLDDLDGLTLTSEIFIDYKPDLYSFANTTHQMTEAEFQASLNGQTETK